MMMIDFERIIIIFPDDWRNVKRSETCLKELVEKRFEFQRISNIMSEKARDFKFLVMVNEKKIRCNVENVNSMNDLYNKVAKKLARSRVSSLEFFDPTFEEWASAVHISDVPDKCKVRITETETFKAPLTPPPPISMPTLRPQNSKKKKRDSMYKACQNAPGDAAERLFHALDNDDEETAMKIIRAGHAKGAVADDGDTVLIWATIMDNLKMVKAILKEDPKMLNEQSSNGNTALMWATEMHHPEIAKFLIEKGASTDFKNHEGMNAISIAKSMGNTQLESVLSGVVSISSEVSGL